MRELWRGEDIHMFAVAEWEMRWWVGGLVDSGKGGGAWRQLARARVTGSPDFSDWRDDVAWRGNVTSWVA